MCPTASRVNMAWSFAQMSLVLCWHACSAQMGCTTVWQAWLGRPAIEARHKLHSQSCRFSCKEPYDTSVS